MRPDGGGKRRPVRLTSYGILFALFALIVFTSHLWMVTLPYYWDEAGQYIPTALDIFHGGAWISHSVPPTIHPPGVPAYIAAAWTLGGYHPATTRVAMLLLASFAVLAAFLLAIELCRSVTGAPAFVAAALLCVSPIFFAQAVLAQLDLPAMLFTSLALLFFLQNRIPLSAAACVVLVLVKETGVVTPLLFAAWLAYEKRWRDAAWFLLPFSALAAWLVLLKTATGLWTGSNDFVRYNLQYPLHPVRMAVTLWRRFYHLFIADFHWIGSAAVVYAWRKSRIFRDRSWRVSGLMVAAYVGMLTVLGGAVLNRYMLPVFPIVFAAAVAAFSLWPRKLRLAAATAMIAGVAAGNFWNPPYPFAFEDNLAFVDFVKLQSDAADYVNHWYGTQKVYTMWPMNLELTRPELGYVSHPMTVETLPNMEAATLENVDWKKVTILVAFSRDWNPAFNLMHNLPLLRFWKKFYNFVPGVDMQEARARIPFPSAAHFSRRGQWIDIYVNPDLPDQPPPHLQQAVIRTGVREAE